MLNQYSGISFSASQIYKQIEKYLLMQKNTLPEKYVDKEINDLLSTLKKGTCNGLVALWLYYQLKNEEKKFLELLSFVCNWKGIEANSQANKAYSDNFEFFINHIMWLQKDFNILFKDSLQSNLHQQLNFLNEKESFENPFKMSFIFTEVELLATVEKIKTALPVVIRNAEHVVAYVKEDDKIRFYNPNNPTGIVVVNNNELVPLIRRALFIDFFNFDQSMALMIDVFDKGSNKSLPKSLDLIISLLALRDKDKKILVTKKKVTTAHMLVLGGDHEALSLLNEQQFAFNQPDHQGLTPLHWAAIFNQTSCLDFLVNIPTDIDNKNHEGNTALYYAVANNHWDNTTCLLDKKADLFLEDKTGISPVKVAILRGHYDLLQKLIKYNYLTKDAINQYALLHFAITHEQFNLVELFMEAGADINSQNHLRQSAFHLVIKRNQRELLKKMLAQKVDFTLKDIFGDNIIHLAIEKSNFAVIRAAKGSIALNESNLLGRKPIHTAIVDNNLNMVYELISAGADINAQDTNGNTPLQLATANHFNEIRSLLLKQGTDPVSNNSQPLPTFSL